MAILVKFPMTPNRKSSTEMPKTEFILEMKYSAIAYNNNAAIEMVLLPKRCTIHPAKGIVNNEPKGNMKSIAPNSASLKPNISFTSGIRDAQLEKISPEKKKYNEIADLCMFGGCSVKKNRDLLVPIEYNECRLIRVQLHLPQGRMPCCPVLQ